MKKLSIIIVIALYLFGCVISQHYTAHGVIVEQDEELFTVAFPSGYEFEFYAEHADDYSIGDRVNLKMNTSGTDNYVLDDYIENVW